MFCSFMVGCDPQTDYKMLVNNRSYYEIQINQKVIISPGNEKPIYEYHGMGGPGSNDKCEAGPGGIGAININIPSNPELKVVKDLSDMNNWTYSKEGNGWKGYKARCYTTITNADIVPK